MQLTGDVLLAAAQIAYLGAFTSTYRTECLKGWVKACTAKGVPCSDRFKLAAVLGDPVKVNIKRHHVLLWPILQSKGGGGAQGILLSAQPWQGV